ncbi:MAG: amidase, partial [Sciscionella sp.]
DVAGCWTRNGTPGFAHRRADSDAEVVARLAAAGAVVIGKTRLHELAWGMITPGCRNPHDPSRMTGGSSGGSAAAVAAGAVPFALGTDTGGSIRNPAALCGVVGVKAVHGSLPMRGVAALAPSQDTLGVLAATTRDCRSVLAALGIGTPDNLSAPRVGFLADEWATRLQPEVATALHGATDQLRSNGIAVDEVTVARSELAPAASCVVMLTEAARQWWRRDIATGALGAQVHMLLRLGRLVAESDYRRAQRVRAAITESLREALAGRAALMLASCPVPAAPIGSGAVPCHGRMRPVETAYVAMTALASLTGLAALSVPSPVPAGAPPIGIQLIGTDPAVLCALAESLPAAGTLGERHAASIGRIQ